MIRDDIIRMAREAGYQHPDAVGTCEDFAYFDLEHFAALVAAAEREACAKVCDNGIANATDWDSSYWDQACANRAAAIRARGEMK